MSTVATPVSPTTAPAHLEQAPTPAAASGDPSILGLPIFVVGLRLPVFSPL